MLKMTQLLAGEFELDTRPGYIGTSREWAADVLDRVSRTTSYGGYPEYISPFDLGRAIGRALANCNDHDGNELFNYTEVQRGMVHYHKNKNT